MFSRRFAAVWSGIGVLGFALLARPLRNPRKNEGGFLGFAPFRVPLPRPNPEKNPLRGQARLGKPRKRPWDVATSPNPEESGEKGRRDSDFLYISFVSHFFIPPIYRNLAGIQQFL